MATTVYLTRHGQTEWNSIGRMMGWTDEDMNETGVSQAERLAVRMAKLQLDAMYASPLKRAMTTGAIVGKSHGIKPKPEQGLIEINYGIWEGLARGEARAKWPELQRQLHDNPSELVIPGGESFKQLALRVVAAFNKIVNAEEGKHLLMVSHQGILKVLVAELIGISYNDWSKFEIQNASYTKMTVNGGHVRVITLNDTSHLDRSGSD